MNLCKAYCKIYEKSFCKVLSKKTKIIDVMVNMIFIVKQTYFIAGRELFNEGKHFVYNKNIFL